MSTPTEAASLLHESGFRITEVRIRIVEILWNSARPLTAAEIVSRIAKSRASINKTTVYRELDAFIAKDLIKAVSFADGKLRYERLGSHHHHHLFCTHCQKVIDVFPDEQTESKVLALARAKHFRVHSHSLEFFGICQSCQSR